MQSIISVLPICCLHSAVGVIYLLFALLFKEQEINALPLQRICPTCETEPFIYLIAAAHAVSVTVLYNVQ